MSTSTYTTHGVTVKFDDNSPQVLAALKKATDRGLLACGEKAVKYARDELERPKAHKSGPVRPNIITWNLYNSLDCALQTGGQDKEVIIGVKKGKADYASCVEFGTRNTWAYPFLKPAATQHTGEYKTILANSLKNA